MRSAYVACGWLMVAAIVWVSLTPSPPRVEFAASDKLGHLLSYGLLMFWFAQLYPGRAARAGYAALFVAMGVTLEFLQGQLDYRTYELFDMLANTAGVLAGWSAALASPRVLR